eukprot:768434-Hanusia_phi.AAC.3
MSALGDGPAFRHRVPVGNGRRFSARLGDTLVPAQHSIVLNKFRAASTEQLDLCRRANLTSAKRKEEGCQ